jgi:uncharacterized membrane protein
MTQSLSLLLSNDRSIFENVSHIGVNDVISEDTPVLNFFFKISTILDMINRGSILFLLLSQFSFVTVANGSITAINLDQCLSKLCPGIHSFGFIKTSRERSRSISTTRIAKSPSSSRYNRTPFQQYACTFDSSTKSPRRLKLLSVNSYSDDRYQSHHSSSRRRARVSTTHIFATSTSGLTIPVIASNAATSTVGIAFTLLASACFALWVEQQQQQQGDESTWTKFLPPSIFIALGTSTALVHVLRRVFHGIVSFPQHHALFDYCWSTILPSSLALLLLSLPSSPTGDTKPSNNQLTRSGYVDDSNPILAAIQRLFVPFIIASVGSIVGCAISFFVCGYSLHILSVSDASHAAACLCASFIGGSINFLATSAILQQGISKSNHALLSAMAAVDIVVMAIYFTILSAALQSRQLHRWFNGSDDDSHLKKEKESFTTLSPYELEDSVTPSVTKTSSVASAAVTLGAMTVAIVELSKRLEFRLKRFVPGTACAFIAMLVPWMTGQINQMTYVSTHPLWKRMQRCAEPMSRLAFLLVFATMGCTLDMSTALLNGPACFIFSFAALAIHGIVTLLGSYVFRRMLHSTNRADLTDILVASNAAIGGPATAAAFCGQIVFSNPIRKRSIAIAATFWGVVGYAIGTTIGVLLYRILLSVVP